jgi:alpha-L-fucosidase
MKHTRILRTFVGILACHCLGTGLPVRAADAPAASSPNDAAAKAAVDSLLAETPDQRDARMAWWRGAKFGMFIHWGPASVSGKEISWSRVGHAFEGPGGDQSQPPEVYDNLYRKFNPVEFNADRWMQMAKKAGMRYVVFVTKHHDGFSMWPTKLRPDYSIAGTPFKRDICKEIADAAHQHGLKLGWYYSTRDWTHPDYLKDGNAKYNEFYHGQVHELLSDYGRVDMLWFDHVAGNWGDYRFEDLFGMIHAMQPGILVNNRAAAFFQGTKDRPTDRVAKLTHGDFDTPEQKIGMFQTHRAWESCVTMTECKDGGGWSYRPDGHTRSFEECIRMLVETVTGDGNLLLNVGPLPNGTIAEDQVRTLERMGGWLEKYGASIYGTRGGPIKNGDWGGATQKGNKVWLHILRWPNDTLRLESLKKEIAAVRVLTGGNATVAPTKTALEITMPEAQRDRLDTIIELELRPE